jgi:hypothetical protein
MDGFASLPQTCSARSGQTQYFSPAGHSDSGLPVSESQRGQSRIQVIDFLPPGKAGRGTETSVLKRAPLALAVIGALIIFLGADPALQPATWLSESGLG